MGGSSGCQISRVIYKVSDRLIEVEFSSLIGSTFLPRIRGGLYHLRYI
jgi:hypothetical protein